MKLTIEAETDDDREQLPEPMVHEHVFEFALCGRKELVGVRTIDFSHRHVQDRFRMIGQLAELTERLRSGG